MAGRRPAAMQTDEAGQRNAGESREATKHSQRCRAASSKSRSPPSKPSNPQSAAVMGRLRLRRNTGRARNPASVPAKGPDAGIDQQVNKDADDHEQLVRRTRRSAPGQPETVRQKSCRTTVADDALTSASRPGIDPGSPASPRERRSRAVRKREQDQPHSASPRAAARAEEPRCLLDEAVRDVKLDELPEHRGRARQRRAVAERSITTDDLRTTSTRAKGRRKVQGAERSLRRATNRAGRARD